MAGAAAFAGVLAGGTASAATLPTFDFTDCPAIPAGAEPSQWRCEVLVSDGTLSFGRFRDLPLGRMRLTFAEGTLDGKYAQVFGTLRAEPTPLPGLPGTSMRVRYAGYSDFLANDERKGEIDLAATLRGPLLPRGCSIGDDSDPIHSKIKQVGGLETSPEDPSVHLFHTIDEQLNVPAARGCGPLTWTLNHRLGLPSPSGGNVLAQTTWVKIRAYS